jgi:hypothetical protein
MAAVEAGTEMSVSPSQGSFESQMSSSDSNSWWGWGWDC